MLARVALVVVAMIAAGAACRRRPPVEGAATITAGRGNTCAHDAPAGPLTNAVPTLRSDPPPDVPLAVTVDGEPIPIVGAVAQVRGERGVELLLSERPLSCDALAGGWQPVAKGEHRTWLTVAPLLLEPMSDGTFAPAEQRWRVGRMSWSRAGRTDAGPSRLEGSGVVSEAGGSAVVEDVEAIAPGAPRGSSSGGRPPSVRAARRTRRRSDSKERFASPRVARRRRRAR